MKSDTCDETGVPSHGRGRRFDPFSAHHLTGVSEPSPGHPEQQQAEQSKSRRGEDVEPRSTSVQAIPTDPKAFRLWLVKQPTESWPGGLLTLAARARQSLDTKDQTAWSQSFALRKAAKADWQAFTTAYAEWEARS